MTYEEKKARAELINMMVNSIPVENEPTELPDRPGFKWERAFSWGTADNPSPSVAWVEVEDPNGQGTSKNPIPWEAGMSVKANYWYTFEGNLYVCVQAGSPDSITDTNYFEPM